MYIRLALACCAFLPVHGGSFQLRPQNAWRTFSRQLPIVSTIQCISRRSRGSELSFDTHSTLGSAVWPWPDLAVLNSCLLRPANNTNAGCLPAFTAIPYTSESHKKTLSTVFGEFVPYTSLALQCRENGFPPYSHNTSTKAATHTMMIVQTLPSKLYKLQSLPR